MLISQPINPVILTPSHCVFCRHLLFHFPPTSTIEQVGDVKYIDSHKEHKNHGAGLNY